MLRQAVVKEITKWRGEEVSLSKRGCIRYAVGTWSRYNGDRLMRETPNMERAQLQQSLLLLRILWFSTSEAEDWLYMCAVRCHLRHAWGWWKNGELCCSDVTALTFSLSSVLQSCGTLSPMTSRRSRSTKATRLLLNVTSLRASPKLKSATASNRSGWKHPKVPSCFSSLGSLPNSLLLPMLSS